MPTMHVRYLENDFGAPQDMDIIEEEAKESSPFDLKISKQMQVLKSLIAQRHSEMPARINTLME